MHYISLSTYLLHLQKFCPIQKQQQQFGKNDARLLTKFLQTHIFWHFNHISRFYIWFANVIIILIRNAQVFFMFSSKKTRILMPLSSKFNIFVKIIHLKILCGTTKFAFISFFWSKDFVITASSNLIDLPSYVFWKFLSYCSSWLFHAVQMH